MTFPRLFHDNLTCFDYFSAADVHKFGEFLCFAFSCQNCVELSVHTHWVQPWSSRLISVQLSYTIFEMRQKIGRSGMAKQLAPDIPHTGSALCSPVPMFPEPMFHGTYVPRYLCSPVPMFPEPMFPGTDVPRYLCSPNLYSPVPMFPDLLQMCCRAYIRRPSDRHWNCRAAKRNISQNVKT